MHTDVLIYSFDILGHHLEYIHHLYGKFLRSGNECVFVIPERFHRVKGKLPWPEAQNIRFDFIPEAVEDRYNGAGTLGKRFQVTRILGRKIRQYRPKQVFCLYLSPVTSTMFLIPHKVSVSGIVYQIPLYRESSSWLTQLRDRMEFSAYVHDDRFSRVYLLNDPDGADTLNRRYGTDKFAGLPDPYLPIPAEDDRDVRKEYGIPASRKLFVHLGAMTWGKGTMDILESLASLPENEAAQYWFFFAGKIGADIRTEFDAAIGRLRGKVDITVLDEFCEYAFFSALCRSCDAIVIPYRRTLQSSGIIGYASQFGKPVIAPGSGLLGKLVHKFSLGYTLEEVTPATLQAGYRAVAQGAVPAPTHAYCEENTIAAFADAVRL